MEERKKTNSETTGFFSFLNIFLYHVFFLMTNFPSVCVCARQAETLRPFRAPPILNIKFPSPLQPKLADFNFFWRKTSRMNCVSFPARKETDYRRTTHRKIRIYWLFIFHGFLSILLALYTLSYGCVIFRISSFKQTKQKNNWKELRPLIIIDWTSRKLWKKQSFKIPARIPPIINVFSIYICNVRRPHWRKHFLVFFFWIIIIS